MQSFALFNEQTVMNVVPFAHNQQVPHLLPLSTPSEILSTPSEMCWHSYVQDSTVKQAAAAQYWQRQA